LKETEILQSSFESTESETESLQSTSREVPSSLIENDHNHNHHKLA